MTDNHDVRLYQHDDERYGLSIGPASFAAGDPAWHRVPIDVIDMEERIINWGRRAGLATLMYVLQDHARAAVEAERQAIAAAIHYPDCWDTAAYPMLADALTEVYEHFHCSECGSGAVLVGYVSIGLLKQYMEKCQEPGLDMHLELLPIASRPPRGMPGAVGLYAAPVSAQDREDAERYRYLVKDWFKGNPDGCPFELANIPPPEGYSGKIDIDAAIDATRAAKEA